MRLNPGPSACCVRCQVQSVSSARQHRCARGLARGPATRRRWQSRQGRRPLAHGQPEAASGTNRRHAAPCPRPRPPGWREWVRPSRPSPLGQWRGHLSRFGTLYTLSPLAHATQCASRAACVLHRRSLDVFSHGGRGRVTAVFTGTRVHHANALLDLLLAGRSHWLSSGCAPEVLLECRENALLHGKPTNPLPRALLKLSGIYTRGAIFSPLPRRLTSSCAYRTGDRFKALQLLEHATALRARIYGVWSEDHSDFQYVSRDDLVRLTVEYCELSQHTASMRPKHAPTVTLATTTNCAYNITRVLVLCPATALLCRGGMTAVKWAVCFVRSAHTSNHVAGAPSHSAGRHLVQSRARRGAQGRAPQRRPGLARQRPHGVRG